MYCTGLGPLHTTSNMIRNTLFGPTSLSDEMIEYVCHSESPDEIWQIIDSCNPKSRGTAQDRAYFISQLPKLLLASVNSRNSSAVSIIFNYAKSHNILREMLEQGYVVIPNDKELSSFSLLKMGFRQLIEQDFLTVYQEYLLLFFLKWACQDGNIELFKILLEATNDIPNPIRLNLLGVSTLQGSSSNSAETMSHLAASSLVLFVLNLEAEKYNSVINIIFEYAQKHGIWQILYNSRTTEGTPLSSLITQKNHLSSNQILEYHLQPDPASRKRLSPESGKESEPRPIRPKLSNLPPSSILPSFSDLLSSSSSSINPWVSTHPSPLLSSSSNDNIVSEVVSSILMPTPLPPPPTPGFSPFTHNQWCSSLLQMVVGINSLKNIYRAFAHSKKNQYARSHQLLEVLNAHQRAIKKKTHISLRYVKKAVKALHRLSEETLSMDATQPENVSKVITLILRGYQIYATQQRMAYQPLVNRIKIIHTYESIGEAYKPDTDIPLVELKKGKIKQKELVGEIHLTLNTETSEFLNLLQNFFNPLPNPGNSFIKCATPKKKYVQPHRLTQITRKFAKKPKELLFSLDRFETEHATQSSKIRTLVQVPILLTLPRQYIEKLDGEPPSYALDAFIIHKAVAGYENGCFITYRLIKQQWWECKGKKIRSTPLDTIKAILNGAETTCIHHYTIIT